MEYKDSTGEVIIMNNFAPIRVVPDSDLHGMKTRVEVYVLHNIFIVSYVSDDRTLCSTIKTESTEIKDCLKNGTAQDILYLLLNGHVEPMANIDLNNPSIKDKTEIDWACALGKLVLANVCNYAYYHDNLYEYLDKCFTRIVAGFPTDMLLDEKRSRAFDIIVKAYKTLELHQGDMSITREFKKMQQNASKSHCKWDYSRLEPNTFSGLINVLLLGLSIIYSDALNMVAVFDDDTTKGLKLFHRQYHTMFADYTGRSVNSVLRDGKYL
jgi:hypothetical protein